MAHQPSSLCRCPSDDLGGPGSTFDPRPASLVVTVFFQRSTSRTFRPFPVTRTNSAAQRSRSVRSTSSGDGAESPPEPPPEVSLSSEQLDALVMAQVGWLKLSEEGRKVLRTHLDTERKAGNRHAIIAASIGPRPADLRCLPHQPRRAVGGGPRRSGRTAPPPSAARAGSPETQGR